MEQSVQIIRDTIHLSNVYQLLLLDSRQDIAFDRLMRLLVKVSGAPVTLVSLEEEDRQYLQSRPTLDRPWATRCAVPLSHSLSQFVFASGQLLIIEDTRRQRLGYDAALVDGMTDDVSVAAYAGVPLITLGGHVVGAFCMIDSRPRTWTKEDLDMLNDLANLITVEVSLRERAVQLKETQDKLCTYAEELEARSEEVNAFADAAAHDLKSHRVG
jgi:GAF domain-containing protein